MGHSIHDLHEGGETSRILKDKQVSSKPIKRLGKKQRKGLETYSRRNIMNKDMEIKNHEEPLEIP